MLASMEAGDRIAGRFELLDRAGGGGMGEVWRARDAESGRLVALKVLTGQVGIERFEREGRLLEELDHTGIVRHVAHGRDEATRPYLAMEWIEGEELGARLDREGLTPREAVILCRKLAEALAALHGRGVVHRDVKPANVLLVGGDPSRPRLTDLGIARSATESLRLTRTGAVMGTPGYMAPEQIQRDRPVDARADLFALGCVLFECVGGRPAFDSERIMAVLAKVLLEEPAPLGELRDGLPDGLESLCAQLLAKDAEHRPANAAQVARALWALEPRAPAAGRARRPDRPPSLTGTELWQVPIVLVRLDDGFEVGLETLRSIASETAARVAALVPERSAVVRAPADRSPSEQVLVTANAALSIARAEPGARIALSAGRAPADASLPIGEAIDRAAELVSSARPGRVRLDEELVALLSDRFEVGAGSELLGPRRDEAGPARTLLGRPVPFVGRRTEMAMLDALADGAFEEGQSRAAVVTGAPGSGKTRLRRELCRALRDRYEGIAIWVARGEPVGAGSAFSLVAAALRDAAGMAAGDPASGQRDRLLRLARSHLGDAHARYVAERLGEIVGVPFDDRDRPQLALARADPVVMGDQIRDAWLLLCDAVTHRGPLAIVIEDLHWGDRPSMELCDHALRVCTERPLVVIGFGRPVLDERLPDAFAATTVQRISLGPLTRKAATKLVRAALGDSDGDAVAHIVERAGGNALCLEELVRAESEGRRGAPPSVLALVEARLTELSPEARRVLRAASILGNTLSAGGLEALLGDAAHLAREELPTLERAEILARRGSGPPEPELGLAFRHDLVREAAYQMLAPDDRRIGHRLAARWLEGTGEHAPMVIAEHWERAGEPDRAVEHYVRAAEQALGGNDFEAADERAGRGERCGARGEALGRLELVRAEARYWLGALAESAGAAARAVRLLHPHGDGWTAAAWRLAVARMRLGDDAEIARLGRHATALLRAVRGGDVGRRRERGRLRS